MVNLIFRDRKEHLQNAMRERQNACMVKLKLEKQQRRLMLVGEQGRTNITEFVLGVKLYNKESKFLIFAFSPRLFSDK